MRVRVVRRAEIELELGSEEHRLVLHDLSLAGCRDSLLGRLRTLGNSGPVGSGRALPLETRKALAAMESSKNTRDFDGPYHRSRIDSMDDRVLAGELGAYMCSKVSADAKKSLSGGGHTDVAVALRDKLAAEQAPSAYQIREVHGLSLEILLNHTSRAFCSSTLPPPSGALLVPEVKEMSEVLSSSKLSTMNPNTSTELDAEHELADIATIPVLLRGRKGVPPAVVLARAPDHRRDPNDRGLLVVAVGPDGGGRAGGGGDVDVLGAFAQLIRDPQAVALELQKYTSATLIESGVVRQARPLLQVLAAPRLRTYPRRPGAPQHPSGGWAAVSAVSTDKRPADKVDSTARVLFDWFAGLAGCTRDLKSRQK